MNAPLPPAALFELGEILNRLVLAHAVSNGRGAVRLGDSRADLARDLVAELGAAGLAITTRPAP